MSSPSPNLLARIEREHPDWVEHSSRPDPSGSRAGSPLYLRLPFADHRPDLEIEVEENEALVRVGRHERLFVWPPEEADEAAAEVVAYVERISRSVPGPASFSQEFQRLNEEQMELLGRMDELLRSKGAVSDLKVDASGPEPHLEMPLLLPPERGLHVRILIGSDAFELEANGAVLRLDRVDFGDDGPVWVDACAHTLEALLEHDLVVRLRRTLALRRTGAVHIPDPEGKGFWNGDPLACLGFGRLRRIRRWWSSE